MLIPASPLNRRNFIHRLGMAAFALPGISLSFSSTSMAESSIANAAALELEKSPLAHLQDRKLGIALVGLGGYSSDQLAPALQETKLCELKGIVTGSPDKASNWKKKYSLQDKNIYNYENFDSIKDNPDIDIIYVVLPNSMHAEYTIRAAKAGKHVICEKPMAINVKEAEEMIAACEQADRLLSIGYRLHFEPHNLAMTQYREARTFGELSKVYAMDGMKIEPGVWRLNKQLAGGGPLMDVGIYCVQAAIYTTGQLPIAVTAKEGVKTDKEKFREVEESLKWTMEFPHGVLAECTTSYAEEMNVLRAEASKGWFALEPAYEYKGINGKTSQGKIEMPQVNQQALQMDDFAKCVLTKTKSKVPGEMGLRDLKILMAIYESARSGEKVSIAQSWLTK